MAKHFDMTVTPWAPLAGGSLTGKYLRGDKGRIKEGSKRLNERSAGITKEVMAIAEELNVKASNVALKWTIQQGFSCIPIIGATKISQLEENLNTLNVTLSEEHLNKLNEVSALEMGFPHDFFKEDGVRLNNYGGFYDRIEKR
jgi:aryl-alcohol dehydrogenase-like predicted oxidoreductase